MKKLALISFANSLIFICTFAQGTGWSWVRTSSYGGSGNAIVRDKWGNLLVTGIFDQPNVTIGNHILYSYGSTDVFLVKYDPQGNLLWAHSAGENGPDEATGVAVDSSGNVFITGTFSGVQMYCDSLPVTGVGPTSFFIAKYDSSGTIQWARSSDGGNLYSGGECITADQAGNSYIAGTYIGAGFSIGAQKLPLVEHFIGIFFAKYDPNGNLLWTQWMDGPGVDQPYAFTTDNAGGLYLTGSSTSGGISFPNGYILESPVQGYNFPFLVHMTTETGSLVWARGIKGYADGTGICADTNGNLYVTGYLLGDSIRVGNTTINGGPGNAFIARYSNSGSPVWAIGTTGGNMAAGPVVSAGSDDNLYLAGQFSSATIQLDSITLTLNGSSPNSNMLAASLDANGNTIWALSAGADSTDALFGIAAGDSGQAYVCGTAGSPSFKAGNIVVNCSGEDIFIAKIGTPASPAAGINEMPESPALNLYPNPNNGNFNVVLPGDASQIQVLNSVGQVMQTHFVRGEQQMQLFIPTAGLFFVKVTTGEQSITQKIIVTE